MIDSLYLEHFKCFAELRLPLGHLTLLTGVNAAGKSSVIQSLVLLQQTHLDSYGASALTLNGNLVRLGRFADVVDRQTGRDSFAIGISSQALRYQWNFQTVWKEAPTAPLASREAWFKNEKLSDKAFVGGSFLPVLDQPTEATAIAEEISANLAAISYLSTDRIGPRETYPIATSVDTINLLGPGGEHTGWFLLQNAERQVTPALCLDATTTLLRQTEAWLAEFFPGAGLDLRAIEGTNLVTMRLRTSQSGEFHRPQNVGYGLTHTLPVLAAGLAAQPGQIIIIENPEAHLHPAAQAKMGNFLARVAAAGAQVILESHSDHVLNGIRRAVKAGLLPSEQVAIHFFNRRDQQTDDKAQVVSPVVTKDGKIEHWPHGFFDQIDEDLAALTDWT